MSEGQQPPTGPQFNPQTGYPVTPGPAGPPTPPPYGFAPVYALPELPRANTAMVLGLVAIVGAFFSCGLTLFVSPFAWVTGVRARRELAANPGRYAGESKANAGLAMGVIGTVLLVLTAIVVAVAIVALVSADWALVEDGAGVSALASTG